MKHNQRSGDGWNYFSFQKTFDGTRGQQAPGGWRESPALLFSAAFRPSRSTSGIQRPSSHLEAAPSAPLMVLWDDIPEALIPPSGGSTVPPDAALRHGTQEGLRPVRHVMRGKCLSLEGRNKDDRCLQTEIFSLFSRVSW